MYSMIVSKKGETEWNKLLKSHVFYGSHNVLFCKVERVHELDQRMRMCVTESCDVTGKYFPDFLVVPPLLLSEVPPYHRAKNTCFFVQFVNVGRGKVLSHDLCFNDSKHLQRLFIALFFAACLPSRATIRGLVRPRVHDLAKTGPSTHSAAVRRLSATVLRWGGAAITLFA